MKIAKTTVRWIVAASVMYVVLMAMVIAFGRSKSRNSVIREVPSVDREARLPQKSVGQKPISNMGSAETVKPAENVRIQSPAKPTVQKPNVPHREKERPASSPSSSSTFEYTVQDGDDIVSVSIRFCVSPSQLLSVNNIKPSTGLRVGQILKIPTMAPHCP